MAGAKAGKRIPRRRMRKAAKKVSKRLMNSEIANVKQAISFRAGALTANKLYGMYNWSLTNCDRAVQVAAAYQFYRITKVEVKVKPSFDTFTQAGATSVPYLYYLIDKAGNFVNSTQLSFNSIRDAGAKPVRFDDKTKTIVIKPAVLTSVNDGQATSNPFAQYKVSPWLTTNANNLITSGVWAPNSTDHYGMVLGVEQDNVGTGTLLAYDVDMVIHFQFKKPRIFATSSSVPLILPDLDDPAYAGTPGFIPGLIDV